jgi:membrane protein required for colicin V production
MDFCARRHAMSGFDLVVLVVIVLSTLFGFLRGLTRESLTVAAWIGALAAAYYGFGAARALAHQTIETGWLADGGALVLVFVVPLIVFKILGAVFADRVSEGWLGPLDHWLGATFGVLRGVLIVCIVYLGLGMVFGPGERPTWIEQGVLVPYVQNGAAWLAGLLPASAGVEPRDLMRGEGR